MQGIPEETPPEMRQTSKVIDGQVFLTTERVRKDVDGVEFITFRTVQPYQGTIDDYKAQLEEVKQQELARHEATLADVENRLVDIQNLKAENQEEIVTEK